MDKLKWVIIVVGELALIKYALVTGDGFVTAVALICGLIIVHEIFQW